MTGSHHTLKEGFFIGHYRIKAPMGRNALGEAYRVQSSQMQRECQLTLIRPELAQDEAFQQRLQDLAPALQALQHPNVARVHHIGQELSHTYITGDLVEAAEGRQESLAALLSDDRQDLTEERTRDIALQVAHGLEFAHDAGVPHLSLTPSHILFSRYGKVVVSGCGEALLLGPRLRQPSEYWSPEQTAGNEGNARSDVFSLGLILYQMLTGESIESSAEPPSSFGVSRRWDVVVEGCLQSGESERFPSVSALLETMSDMEEDEASGRAFKVMSIVLVTLLVLGLIVAGALTRVNALKKQQHALEQENAEVDATETELVLHLDAARAALAVQDYAEAGKAIAEARKTAPDDGRVVALQAEIDTAASPNAVEQVRKQANAAWQAIENLEGGQGLDHELNTAWTLLKHGRKYDKAGNFREALVQYEACLKQCEKVRRMDQRRLDAQRVRVGTGGSEAAAKQAGAEELAEKLWGQALAQVRAADAAFDDGKIDEALKGWTAANGTFAEAEKWAAGAEPADSARLLYQSRLSRLEPEALAKESPTEWAVVQKAASEAESHTLGQQWTKAVKSWHQAATALAKAAKLTEGAQNKEAFDAAYKRAGEAVATRRWNDAMYAFADALAVPGYADHAKARQGKAQARAMWEREGALQQERIAPAKETGNMVPNSGFEKGGKHPDRWTPQDWLTIFWEDGGVKGKCLHLDTNVYRSEWEAHMKNPVPGKKKTPTKGRLFNTVGGTVGDAVYSYPIAVEEDAWYQVEYDIKGPAGEQFIFLKGYWRCEPEDVDRFGKDFIFFRPDPKGAWFSLTEWGGVGQERHQPRPGDYVMSLKRRFVAKMPKGGKGKWHRHRGVIHLERRHHVEAVLLEIYGFWPAGDYYFDNVTMQKIPAAQGENFKAWRLKNPEGIPLKAR